MVDESPHHVLDELRDRVVASAPDRHIHLILENETNICVPAGPRLCRRAAELLRAVESRCHSSASGCLLRHGHGRRTNSETEKLCIALAEGFNIAVRERGAVQDCKPAPNGVRRVPADARPGRQPRLRRPALGAYFGRGIARAQLRVPASAADSHSSSWARNGEPRHRFRSSATITAASRIRSAKAASTSSRSSTRHPAKKNFSTPPDPQAESTFRSAQLDWDELSHPEHSGLLDWYKRLIAVRREHIAPFARRTGRPMQRVSSDRAGGVHHFLVAAGGGPADGCGEPVRHSACGIRAVFGQGDMDDRQPAPTTASSARGPFAGPLLDHQLENCRSDQRTDQGPSVRSSGESPSSQKT